MSDRMMVEYEVESMRVPRPEEFFARAPAGAAVKGFYYGSACPYRAALEWLLWETEGRKKIKGLPYPSRRHILELARMALGPGLAGWNFEIGRGLFRSGTEAATPRRADAAGGTPRKGRGRSGKPSAQSGGAAAPEC